MIGKQFDMSYLCTHFFKLFFMNKKVKENEGAKADDSTLTHEDEPLLPAEEEQPEGNNLDVSANEQLQKELDELKDKYLRMAAEYDNYRRRTAKEVLDIRQTASRDLMVSLLDVLDDMDRAESQFEQNAENTTHHGEGVQLIFNKFRKILEQKGLKQIETMYTDFDVEKDEAISEMVVEDEKLKGKVVAEVQKGYLLNDKLIRYAKVVVGK